MNREDIKRKLVAIFSADAKDYSLLMRDDEAATVETITAYREVMFTLIKQHHGRVVDSPGDNILAEFASVVDAVQSAVAIQKELKARNAKLPDNRKMEFRIGINLGDVIVEGGRLYGDGVNITARLEGLADPGGICISRTAYDQIEDKLPLGYEYLGEQSVKNIVKPVRAYRVLLEPADSTGAKKEKKPGRRVKTPRPARSRLREKHAEPKDRPTIQFNQLLWTFLGVIGVILTINLLTWKGRLWAQWPALGWGLLFYFHWLNLRIKNRVSDKRKKRFYKHLGIYLGVIVALTIINLMAWKGHFWVLWPALVWGTLLFLHWLHSIKSPQKTQE